MSSAYYKDIVPVLAQKLGYKNLMMVPRIKKIVVNVGLGEAIVNPKSLDMVSQQLQLITGQKPQVTKARKAIASFKLRDGQEIGLKVTLRNKRMEDFLTKLIAVALPRVRDFRGVAESFDTHGNYNSSQRINKKNLCFAYNLGIKEYTIFPEVDLAAVDKLRGLQVAIVTTAKDAKDAKALLVELGMPFVRSSKETR